MNFLQNEKITIFLLFCTFSIVFIISVYNFQNYYPISMKVVQYMKFYVSVRLQKKKYENMKNLDFKSNYAFFPLFFIVFIVYNAYIFRNCCQISIKFGLYVYFEVRYQKQSENFQNNTNYGFFYCSPFFLLFMSTISDFFSIWLKFV